MNNLPFFKILLAGGLGIAFLVNGLIGIDIASAASKKKQMSKTETSTSGDTLKSKLDAFAQRTLAMINRNVLPSKNKKEVIKNPNGSFTARYIEVDLTSVRTSYKKSENSKTVPYIGYMNYTEVEYINMAPTKEAAEAGPFKVNRKEGMTEIIKYMKNDWTY